jgi:hypothetical protein
MLPAPKNRTLGKLNPDWGKVALAPGVTVGPLPHIQSASVLHCALRQKPAEQTIPDWQLALEPQVPPQALGAPAPGELGVAVTPGAKVGVGVADTPGGRVGVGVAVIPGARGCDPPPPDAQETFISHIVSAAAGLLSGAVGATVSPCKVL